MDFKNRKLEKLKLIEKIKVGFVQKENIKELIYKNIFGF